MILSKIKIPDKQFVGMVKRKEDSIPVAFITEWGNDKLSAKRMKTISDTVKRFAGRRGVITLPTTIVYNEPMTGFKINGCSYTGGYKTYDKFFIQDPRGFQTEISSGNVEHLLANALVKNGEILDECVWCRNNNINVLILTSSDVYQTALSNTVAAKNSDNWKKVKIGNTVLLRNNIQGVYLGYMNVLQKGYNNERYTTTGSDELISLSNKYHVIHVNKSPGYASYTNFLMLIAKPKLSAIVDASNDFTEVEAEVFANECLADSLCSVESGPYGQVISLSFGPTIKRSIRKIPQQIVNSKSLRHIFDTSDNILFVKRTRRFFGKLSYFGNHRCNLYRENHLKQGQLRRILEFGNDPQSPIAYEKSIEYHFEPSDEFLFLEIEVKTPLGTTITVVI